MTQLDLTFTPASRRSDSAASKRAEQRQNLGQRNGDSAKVLKALCATPNTTSKGLAEQHGMDRYMVAKRLPDLLRNNLVDRAEDPDSGEYRWNPTAAGKRVVEGWK